MAQRKTKPAEDVISITLKYDGAFIPPSGRLICSPIPGREGIEYVPDWWGITEFG